MKAPLGLTSWVVYQLKQTHSASEFKTAGYIINELTIQNDFTISQLRLVGHYTATVMKDAEITASNAKDDGYSLFYWNLVDKCRIRVVYGRFTAAAAAANYT